MRSRRKVQNRMSVLKRTGKKNVLALALAIAMVSSTVAGEPLSIHAYADETNAISSSDDGSSKSDASSEKSTSVKEEKSSSKEEKSEAKTEKSSEEKSGTSIAAKSAIQIVTEAENSASSDTKSSDVKLGSSDLDSKETEKTNASGQKSSGSTGNTSANSSYEKSTEATGAGTSQSSESSKENTTETKITTTDAAKSGTASFDTGFTSANASTGASTSTGANGSASNGTGASNGASEAGTGSSTGAASTGAGAAPETTAPETNALETSEVETTEALETTEAETIAPETTAELDEEAEKKAESARIRKGILAADKAARKAKLGKNGSWKSSIFDFMKHLFFIDVVADAENDDEDVEDESISEMEVSEDDIDDYSVDLGKDYTANVVDDEDHTSGKNCFTSIIMARKVSGKWKAQSEFHDEDSVRISLAVSIPSDAMDEDSRVFYYQLPASVTISEEQTGLMKRDDIVIGKYVLTEDGMLVVKLTDNISVSQKFRGIIVFDAELAKDSDQTMEKIDFGSYVFILHDGASNDSTDGDAEDVDADVTDETEPTDTVQDDANKVATESEIDADGELNTRAGVLRVSNRIVTASANFPAETFPIGTKMQVVRVKKPSELKTLKNKVDAQLESENSGKIAKDIYAYDISFIYDGEKIEPLNPVDISLSFNKSQGKPKATTKAEDPEKAEWKMFHATTEEANADDSVAEEDDNDDSALEETKSVSESNRKLEDSADSENLITVDSALQDITEDAQMSTNSDNSTVHQVDFSSDMFSVFVLAYTVDFHYGNYTYNLAGNSEMLVSELFNALEIDKSISEVSEVTFSNDELVEVEEVKDSNGTVVDWKIISKGSFNTEETLTITFTSGEYITISVTDPVVDQGATITVAAQSSDTKLVGQSNGFRLSSTNSDTNNSKSAARTFKLTLKGFDPNCETVQFMGRSTMNIDDSINYDGKDYTLKKDSDGNYYITYTLQPGEIISGVLFTIGTKNGISGDNLEVSAVPSLDGEKKDNDVVGNPATLKWSGSFAWENIEKSVNNSNAAITKDYVNGNKQSINSDLVYSIHVNSKNRESEGKVWTEYTDIVDTLTLPEGITIGRGEGKESFTYLKNYNTIAYKPNGKESKTLLQFEDLPEGTTVSDISYEGNKLTYKLHIPSNKMSSNVPTEETSDIAYKVTLFATDLNINSDKLDGQKITNKVDFDAEAYNSDANSISSSTAETVLRQQDNIPTITKDATKTVNPGDEITYTLTAYVDGDKSLTKDIIDTLPEGVTLTDEEFKKLISENSFKESDVTYDKNSRTITWKNQSIPAKYEKKEKKYQETGDTWKAEFKVTVNKDFKEKTLVNKAKLDDQQVKAETKVNQPNVHARKYHDDVSDVVSGDIVTYHIKVENTGSAPAKNVDVQDELPKELLVKDEITGKTLQDLLTQKSNGEDKDRIDVKVGGREATAYLNWNDKYVIVWKLDKINANSNTTITYSATVGDLTEKYKNKDLKIKNDITRPNWNEDVITIKDMTPHTNLKKNATLPNGKEKVTTGDIITYTVTVENTGNVKIKNHKVTDTIPKELVLLDDNGNEITKSSSYKVGKQNAEVTINSDGTTTAIWTISTLPAEGNEKKKQFVYKTKVRSFDASTEIPEKIRNVVTDDNNKNGKGTDVPVERPDVPATKTHSKEDENKKKGGVVTYTVFAKNNSSSATATKVVLTDKMPSSLVPLDDNGNEITSEGSYRIGGHEVSVSIKNGETYIDWSLLDLAPNAESEHITFKAKIRDANNGQITNITYTNYSDYSYDYLPTDTGKDDDKKILESGHEKTTTEVKGGGTVTYLLKLINENDEAAVFKHVYDTLPTFDNLTYSFDKASDDHIYVTVGNLSDEEKALYPDAVDFAMCDSTGTPKPTESFDYDAGGKTLSWKYVLVPAGKTAIAKVTFTFPSLNSTQFKALQEYTKNNTWNKFENTFGFEGGAQRKVQHTVEESPDKYLYIQKGVEKLADIRKTIERGGKFYYADNLSEEWHDYNNDVSFTTSSASSSKTTYIYDPDTKQTYVSYYAFVLNTGKSKVTIDKIVDNLPEGLSFLGLSQSTWNPYQYRDKDGTNYNLDIKIWTGNNNQRVSFSGGSYATYANMKQAIINTKQSGVTGSVVFNVTETDGVTPLTLADNQWISFAIVCKVDHGVVKLNNSENQLQVVAEGLVNKKKPDCNITSSIATSDGKNDAEDCEVSYDPSTDKTTFSSEVTIYPVEANKFKPGITKTAVQYYDSIEAMKKGDAPKNITDDTVLTGFEPVIWKIHMTNSGFVDMPVTSIRDTITSPWTLTNEEGFRAKLNVYTKNSDIPTVYTLPIPNGNADSNEQNITYIFDTSNLQSGNNLTIQSEGYADLYVISVPDSHKIVTKTFVNKATMTVGDTFSSFAHGEPGGGEQGQYTTLTDQDSVIARVSTGASASKTVTGIRTNKDQTTSVVSASSEDADSGNNYISMNKAGQTVTYSINFTNEGSVPVQKLVMIDNLPKKGDVGPVNIQPRGSKFSVNGTKNLAVYYIEPNGTTNLMTAEDYSVQYSSTRESEFTDEEFNGDAVEGWDASGDDARAIRIIVKKTITAGATVTAKWDSVIGDDAKVGQVAWNSYGYYVVPDTKGGAIEPLKAAPPRVGVTIESTITKIELEKIATKQPDSRKNDIFTFGLRLYKADENGNKTNEELDADLYPVVYTVNGEDRPIESIGDKHQIKLKAGEKSVINGIPSGVYYSITEDDADFYVLDKATGTSNTEADGAGSAVINGKQVSGQVGRKGESVQYTNKYIGLPYTLPATGSVGTTWIYILGSIMMLLSAGVYILKHKEVSRK